MSIVEADQTPADLPTAPAFCSISGRAEDSGRNHCNCSSIPTVFHGSTTSKVVTRTDFFIEEKECFLSILFHWEKIDKYMQFRRH